MAKMVSMNPIRRPSISPSHAAPAHMIEFNVGCDDELVNASIFPELGSDLFELVGKFACTNSIGQVSIAGLCTAVCISNCSKGGRNWFKEFRTEFDCEVVDTMGCLESECDGPQVPGNLWHQRFSTAALCKTDASEDRFDGGVKFPMRSMYRDVASELRAFSSPESMADTLGDEKAASFEASSNDWQTSMVVFRDCSSSDTNRPVRCIMVQSTEVGARESIELDPKQLVSLLCGQDTRSLYFTHGSLGVGNWEDKFLVRRSRTPLFAQSFPNDCSSMIRLWSDDKTKKGELWPKELFDSSDLNPFTAQFVKMPPNPLASCWDLFEFPLPTFKPLSTQPVFNNALLLTTAADAECTFGNKFFFLGTSNDEMQQVVSVFGAYDMPNSLAMPTTSGRMTSPDKICRYDYTKIKVKQSLGSSKAYKKGKSAINTKLIVEGRREAVYAADKKITAIIEEEIATEYDGKLCESHPLYGAMRRSLDLVNAERERNGQAKFVDSQLGETSSSASSSSMELPDALPMFFGGVDSDTDDE